MKVRSKKNNDLRLLADELVETGLKKGPMKSRSLSMMGASLKLESVWDR